MDQKVYQQVVQSIDAEWLAQKAVELVSVDSVTMDEEDVCGVYQSQMEALGLDVDVREVTPGRNNLYACIKGEGSGPSLIYNGHLDTIPIGICPPCKREGDRIYGRGSADMKGGMTSLLGMAQAILDTDVKLKGDVWITAVVGHEEPEADKDGPKAFIEDLNNGRIQGDRIVIAEGWDRVWLMSMGSMVFHITLTSDKGGKHTQYVPFSENPIRFVGDLIQRINAFQDELDASSGHPLAGPERMDVGIVNAGDYFNRTPTQCVLTGTRRWAPGRTAEEVLAEMKELVRPFAEAGGLSFEVEMVHEREPFETAQDDLSVQAFATAHKAVVGQEAEFEGKRIVGDANLYVHGTGVPTFYYGPSNDTAHADLEWVSVNRIHKTAQVYAHAAMTYCGIRS